MLRDKGPPFLLCGDDDKWKRDLEELLQLNQVVTVLSIGDIKYDTLNYLKAHPNIQTLEMFTKYYKKGEKRFNA